MQGLAQRVPGHARRTETSRGATTSEAASAADSGRPVGSPCTSLRPRRVGGRFAPAYRRLWLCGLLPPSVPELLACDISIVKEQIFLLNACHRQRRVATLPRSVQDKHNVHPEILRRNDNT